MAKTKAAPAAQDVPKGPLWPADKVQRRPVADLVPYARNSRTHSEVQVDQIAASIREFGFTVPVLLDEAGTIIAGHGRVMAAKKLGLVDVPTMTAEGWSKAKMRAYVIADNKLAQNAGWDFEMLAAELADLQDDGFDINLIGFDDKELDKLLKGEMTEDEQATGSSELDAGGFQSFDCTCPKCGFEFDNAKS